MMQLIGGAYQDNLTQLTTASTKKSKQTNNETKNPQTKKQKQNKARKTFINHKPRCIEECAHVSKLHGFCRSSQVRCTS